MFKLGFFFEENQSISFKNFAETRWNKEIKITNGWRIPAKIAKQVDTECLVCKKTFCLKCLEYYDKENLA